MTRRKEIDNIERHTVKKRAKRLPAFILAKIKDDYYFQQLSFNKNAIEYINCPKNYHKINWVYLSSNPNAIHMLEENKKKINWYHASRNKNKDIIPLLEERIRSTVKNNYKNYVHWDCILSSNFDVSSLVEIEFQKPLLNNRILRTLNYRTLLSSGNYFHILEKYKQFIDWVALSKNENGIKMIEAELNEKKSRVVWYALCQNKNAIDILTKESMNEPNRIDWEELSANKNAIDILRKEAKKEPNRIDWYNLCSNENAMDIIMKESKKQPNRIVWESLCFNKNAKKLVIDEYKKNRNTVKVHEMLLGNDHFFPLIKSLLTKDQVLLDIASVHFASTDNLSILKFIKKMFPKLYYPTVNKDDDTLESNIVNSEQFWSRILANPLIFQL